MKTSIEYTIVAVPFHADAATHDELARKAKQKLSGGYELYGPPFPQRGNDASGFDEADPAPSRRWLGIRNASGAPWLYLAAMLLAYAALTRLVKTWFIRRFDE